MIVNRYTCAISTQFSTNLFMFCTGLCYNAGMATNALLTSAVDTDNLRDANGRFLRKPDNLRVLTSAEASQISRKRWDNYRRASAKGIMKEAQAIDPSVQTPADAYALVVGKQYLTLLDSDKPKMDDVYRLGQIVGALPNAHDKVQHDTAVQTAQIVGDVVRDLAQLSAVWADVVARQANAFDNSNYQKQEDSGTADSGGG